MKLKLISISNRNTSYSLPAKNKLFELASNFLPGTDAFESYENSKDFLVALSKSFESSDIILIAADTEIFLDQKQLLMRSLHLKSEFNNNIIKRISSSTADDAANAKTITSHSVVPKGAEVFLTLDGMYSAFALKSGNQHLIFVPLNEQMIDTIMTDGLSDYLVFAISPEKFSTQSAQTMKNDIDEQSPAYLTYQTLSDANLRTAIAVTQTSGLVKKRFSEVIELTKYIEFIACEDVRDPGTSLKTHVSALAKTAMDKGKTDLGAAVSTVYSSDDDSNLFVLVAVANKDYARLIKLCNENGESAKELANSAVDMLFSMLCEYTENNGIPPEGSVILSMGEVQNSEDAVATKYKKKKAALGIAIAFTTALVLCVLVAVFFDNIKALVTRFTSGNTVESHTAEYVYTPPESDYSTLLNELLNVDLSLTDESQSASTDNFSEPAPTNKPAKKPIKVEIKPTRPENTPPSMEDEVEHVTVPKPTSPPTSATTSPSVTTNPSSETTTQVPRPSTGTFVFKTKGYGHGVGMSQNGALAYAKNGWNCDKILLHYYPGTAIITDSSVPQNVTFGKKVIDIKTYLARTARAEIGNGTASTLEAMKAQIVAIYTFAKYYNFNVSASQHAYYTGDSYNSLIDTAVNDVLGKYVAYNGKPAFTPYYASSAGKTTSAQSTWGGSQYPYLSGGVESIESISEKTVSITSDELRAYVESYSTANINLSDNPADWLEIVSTDSGGYVEKIRIGDVLVKGYSFRYNILKNQEIISHCFTFEYIPD